MRNINFRSHPEYWGGALATLVVAIPALLPSIRDASTSGDWWTLSSYLLWLLVAAIAVYSYRPALRKYDPPTPEQFGIRASTAQLWPRTEVAHDVAMAITTHATSAPLVITGESGVGKSTLVITEVIPQLNKWQWETVYIDADTDLATSLVRNLRSCTAVDTVSIAAGAFELAVQEDQRWCIIIDHAERIIPIVAAEATDTTRTLQVLVACIAGLPNARCVLITRPEAYAGLIALGEQAPTFHNCVPISRPTLGPDINGDIDLSERFIPVTRSRADAEAIIRTIAPGDKFLPVEAQILGVVLEDYAKHHQQITWIEFRDRWPDADAIRDEFVELYVRASPQRDVAIKVVAALGALSGRRQASSRDLIFATHELDTDVHRALDYLTENGLVSRLDAGGRYEVANDYVAWMFAASSGRLLDPVDRDNIAYYFDATLRDDVPPTRGLWVPPSGKRTFADVVAVIVLVALLLRLLVPTLNIDPLSHSGVPSINTGSVIDGLFLPVALCYAAWMLYLRSWCSRLFLQLNERRYERVLTIGLVVAYTVAIGFTMFYPEIFVAVIGALGLVFGLKLAAYSLRRDFGQSARGRLRRIGITTAFSMSILFFFGLFGRHVVANGSLGRTGVLVAFYLAGAMLTYACATLYPRHVTQGAASQMLGLIDRGGSGR